MKFGRRRFQSSQKTRFLHKMFVISTEGQKTEQQYFELFNDRKSVIRIHCLKCKSDSSPKQVLNRIKIYLREEKLLPSDEAWVVVDKDMWTDEQLAQLHTWSITKKNYGFALSNPKFEFWLLLHFDKGENISSSSQCDARLKKHLPEYDKQINARYFTPEKIDQAVQRAKELDRPPCADWPRKSGSTVYRLVERIRENSSHE